MKVGIVTLLGDNYGGALQAYALKKILEKKGQDVQIINYTQENTNKSIKDLIKKIVYRNRIKKFKKFRSEYFNLTKKFENISELKDGQLDFDAYIAGSDQIWNQQIPLDERKIYYLDFVKNAKKISYAASVGRDTIEEAEKEEISMLLDNMDFISIREKTGVDLYKKLTNKEIVNVLDPTLLLNQSEWKKITKEYNSKEKYICVYLLGPNKSTIQNINKMTEDFCLPIREISYKKNFKSSTKNENDLGPREFLGIFENAEMIITNSFHGTVFSILNKKPFWVYTRGNMNSRIYDLLKILGLEDRIIKEEKFEYNTNKIDYEEVYRKLEEERKKSNAFLDRALSFEEKESEN